MEGYTAVYSTQLLISTEEYNGYTTYVEGYTAVLRGCVLRYALIVFVLFSVFLGKSYVNSWIHNNKQCKEELCHFLPVHINFLAKTFSISKQY